MKGFKKDGKFIPTGSKSKSNLKKADIRNKKMFHSCPDCERAEKEQIERANNLKRNKQTFSDEKIEINKKGLLKDAHPVYVEMVNRFPQSSVGSDVNYWASTGLRGGHGHFGDALREGKIADAMYRADSDNLVYLDEIGIEPMLSDVQHHPDDPSDRATFRGRADWAKKYVANGHKNEGE